MFSRTPNTMSMVPKRFEASLMDHSKSKNLHTTQKMKHSKSQKQNQQKRAKWASKDYYRNHGPNCGYLLVLGISGYLLVVGISGYLLIGRIGG